MGGKELRIDVKLVVLSAVLITLIIAVVGLWSAKTHEQQLRQELVEQARGFASTPIKTASITLRTAYTNSRDCTAQLRQKR